MKQDRIYPMLQALLAAFLFGASAPLSKLLLGDVEPIPLAACLYLGSGIGLLCVKTAQHFMQRSSVKEARIETREIPWLVGAILASGVAAPIVLLFSLKNTPAATAGISLNDGHHDHEGQTPQKHSHVHEREEMVHDHHHMPDIHHRQVHKSGAENVTKK